MLDDSAPSDTAIADDQVEQPRSGLLWLCKGCGAALVARGAYGSGWCAGCRDDVAAGSAPL